MNNYNPPLTLKQRLQHIRYSKIEKQLKPLCRWVDFYDYIWSYNPIDWKGKAVLDIGADIGSSAIYFLMNGAKHVVLIENDPKSIREYGLLKNDEYLNGIFRKTEMHLPQSMLKYSFDILKMDCEGCELSLLTEDLLKKSNEFVIGLHKPQLDDYQFEQKKRLLEKYGGKYYGAIVNKQDGITGEYIFIKKV